MEIKAEELKEITPERLQAFFKTCVGRKDFYWQYFPQPKGLNHIKKELTDLLIKEHLIGKTTLGLSPFIDNENVVFFGIDIDVHIGDGEKKEMLNRLNGNEKAYNEFIEAEIRKRNIIADAELNKITDWLTREQFMFFVNSSGSKGKHIRIYSNKPINAKMGRLYLNSIFNEILKINVPEIFPKQDFLTKETPYGNQMKGVLGLHPKYKKRANIMQEDGSIMSFTESLDFLIDFQKKLPSATQFPPADWRPTEKQKAEYTKKPFNKNNTKQIVPKYCEFLEEIACARELPSEGEKNRHKYLDGSIYQYTLQNNKEELLEKYKKMQGRDKTAFNNADNWIFSCGSIYNYIKNYPENEILKDCQGMCSNCKYKQNEPPTLKKSLISIFKRIQKGGFKISLKDFNGRIKDYNILFEEIKQAKNDEDVENVILERLKKTNQQKNVDILYNFLEQSKINLEKMKNDFEQKERQKAQTETQSNPEAFTEYREKALEILKSGDPIQFILDSHKTLHVGDENIAKTLITSLGCQCVLNSDGIQPKVSGESGKGKSHCCKAFLHLIPQEWKLETTLSDKVLYYSNIKAGVTIYSDDTEFSEGMEGTIKRCTTNFQSETYHTTLDGKTKEVRTISIPPRINWWLTSVNDTQSKQLLNRQFGEGVDEGKEQDNKVFEFQRKMAKDGEMALPERENVFVCREIISEVKKNLLAVSIQYADGITWNDKGNRRNFPIFLDMIKAFAIFRFKQRSVYTGKLLAEIEDYESAKDLYTSRAESQGLKLNDRELMFCKLLAECGEGDEKGEADSKTLQDLLKLSQGTIYALIHGRPNKPESGLLNKVAGLSFEKRSEKCGNGYASKIYYKLKGFDKDKWASYSKVVILSEEAKSNFVAWKNEHKNELTPTE